MSPASEGPNTLPVNIVLLLGDMSLVQNVGGSASTERQEEARNSWEQHCGLHSATADVVCGLLTCCSVWHKAVAAHRNILKANFGWHPNHSTVYKCCDASKCCSKDRWKIEPIDKLQACFWFSLASDTDPDAD